uniref:SP110 nuclear antigen, tandem duplicate 2 n=1 Tax=Myripristis murdjan TaxID=586833 RepID=A0A667YI17_9TELE
PLKKGQMGDIWNWPIYKTQLPVTCGKQEGTLNRDRLAKGMKCIVVDNKWFTPIEFEKFSGKTSFKNWKLSIRCRDTTLGKLIKVIFKIFYFKLCHGEKQQEPGDVSLPSANERLKYHAVYRWEKRQKYIRTEKCWMTPVEFVQEGCSDPDASWKKDIEWEGNPLGALFETKAMEIHSVLCKCRFCKPDQESLNDDECFICRSHDEEDLVVCDHCPRSFHPKCHLPHVTDSIQWMCTFCVLRTTQQWLRTAQVTCETVLSRPISQHLMVRRLSSYL